MAAAAGAQTLQELVDEHRLSAGSPIRLIITGEPAPLDADASLAIYRTAQEALSNVRTFLIKDDQLHLSQQADAGILTWKRA